VVAGTLAMPVRRYARYTVIGAVVWALVYVGLGSAASAAVRGSAHLLGPTVTAVAVSGLAVALVVRTVHRRRAARAEAAEASVPTPGRRG
ncbi:DedA family protein, partial [Pseudonocardia sp. KRD-291]|nr:DedA family protein [Pseudonocardia sp. KRD291]